RDPLARPGRPVVAVELQARVLAKRGPSRRAGGRGPGLCPRPAGPPPRHQAVQPAARHSGQRLGGRLRGGQGQRRRGPDANRRRGGTLRYLAPERLRGQSDPRGDVYSPGLTLYELLTLRPAFDAADRERLIQQVTQGEPPRPRQLEPGVPRDLETIAL